MTSIVVEVPVCGTSRTRSPPLLQVYAQRLGCDLNRPAAVSRTLGDAFLLVSEALADPGLLQFPPSVTAAAVLVAARKAQVRAVRALSMRLPPGAAQATAKHCFCWVCSGACQRVAPGSLLGRNSARGVSICG